MVGHRALYRVRQFVRVCNAAFSPVDEAYVTEKLQYTAHSATLLRLFHAMSRIEQHHGVDVCRVLDCRGYTDPDLHVAALLHDVGKAVAPPHLWERVLVVLVEHVAPTAVWGARRGATPDGDGDVPRGLRRAFVVRRRHARWGAQMAAEAGAPPRAVTLIGHHHDGKLTELPRGDGPEAGPYLELLAALQAADET